MSSNIGKNLKRLRSESGLSLPLLATKAGLSKGYLWQLEEGENENPSIEILKKLAEALGVTVVDLTGGITMKPRKKKLEKLPPGLKQFVESQKSKGEELTARDIEMLANIQYRGHSPRTLEDWLTVYTVIKSISRKR